MASRLSEESLTGVYDTGLRGMAIQSGEALELLSGPTVDLDKLLLAEDPAAAVQAVAPQALYQALMRRGPEDALEVLRHLSDDQVSRLFDYDVWSGDQLAPLKAIRWLTLFKELGQEELYKRFRGLDEEYQLALLGPVVKMFDEDEYEKLPQTEQDRLNRMPCGTVFYRVESEDPRIEEFCSGLLEAAVAGDINYAYALLAHAAYLPPHEQEDQIARFRRARLEEDGFVPFEESLEVFRPLDLAELKRKWSFLLGRDEVGATPSTPATASDDLFLMAVLNHGAKTWSPAVFDAVSKGFATLGNSLAAAAKIEPDDLDGLKRLLAQGQALSSLGLEWLAAGDVKIGAELLEKEPPKTLFRSGISLVGRLADAVVTDLARHSLPEADVIAKHLRLDKRGMAIQVMERSLLGVLGLERLETLKGLVNRFPVRPVTFTTDQDGICRVLFEPVSSRRALGQLAESLDGIAGLLYLADLAGAKLAERDLELDRALTTGLSRVLIGGSFAAKPLSRAEVETLASLSREAVQTAAADFFAGVEGTLRMALTNSGTTWSVSRAGGVTVADPVQKAMNELSDLIMRLTAAIGRADAQEPAAIRYALEPLVDLEGGKETLA